jgi:hypothetical protein
MLRRDLIYERFPRPVQVRMNHYSK